METFGRRVPISSPLMETSVGERADRHFMSNFSDDSAAVASDLGFIESQVEVAEPESDTGIAVSGFGAWARSELAKEFNEEAFPRIQSFAYVIGKRTFDILFALAAIIALLPFMVAIAIAIKLTSAGPIFFLQDRVGQDGIFRMVKFRSMYLNDQSDTHHTSFGDPRITSVGALLRRTSLDELPQLFNVVKGEMSIVGPRPELVRFVHKFGEEIPGYMARHVGKGGITGWAQVNGFRGSGTSIATRIEYDLDYLRNWSFCLDLKIVLMTVCKGLVNNAF